MLDALRAWEALKGTFEGAHLKCQRSVQIHSKFGWGSSVGMLTPTMAATSSYVMDASILYGFLARLWMALMQSVSLGRFLVLAFASGDAFF